MEDIVKALTTEIKDTIYSMTSWDILGEYDFLGYPIKETRDGYKVLETDYTTLKEAMKAIMDTFLDKVYEAEMEWIREMD